MNQFHVQQQSVPPFADEYFAGFEDVEVLSQEALFQLDDAILAAVARHVNPRDSEVKRFADVITYVMGDPIKNYDYQSGANHTANDAYYRGDANCMSLSILGYALAKAANTNVVLQRVHTPAYWQDMDGYVVNTSHINVRFEPKKRWVTSFATMGDHSVSFDTSREGPNFELDFFPEMAEQDFKRKALSENEVTSLFYSNVASEYMMQGESVKAYAYFKAALVKDPESAAAWLNLGVLYRRQGLDDLALRSYVLALQNDPKHVSAINNVLALAKDIPDTQLLSAGIDVDTLQRRLDRMRTRNPYYHQYMASRAYQQGAYQQAIDRYKKALSMKSREHQFHFGLAKAFIANGQADRGQKHLEKALDLAFFDDDVARYEGKLAYLETLSK